MVLLAVNGATKLVAFAPALTPATGWNDALVV
jgi:hypothetical protein